MNQSPMPVPSSQDREAALFALAVAFNPAADILASTGKDRTIRFWSTATGREMHQINDLAHPGQSLAFSPDGEHIAVSRSNGEVAIWNLKAVEAQLAKLGLNP